MKINPIIKINQMSKGYPIAGKTFMALKDLTISFKEGEFAGIVGPSGSGKTTLLNIIGSLDKPTEGQAIVLDQNISDLTHRQAALFKKYKYWIYFSSF